MKSKKDLDASNSLGLLVRALAFSAHKHRNQRRKDAAASPYINHPIALADVLVHEGGVHDPVVLAAALLHDTIEDTETSVDELTATFGDEITGIVLEVSDDKTLPNTERKRRQVEHAPHLSRRAKLIKLADKICNLRDIADHPPAKWSRARKLEYFEWAHDVIGGLRGVSPKLEAAFDVAYARRPRRRPDSPKRRR